MPQKKKKTEGKEVEPVFVLTLPLDASVADKKKLDSVFRCANKMKNNLIAYFKNQLEQMQRTREWRDAQAAIAEQYALRDKDPKNFDEKPLENLFRKRNKICGRYGFSERKLESKIQDYRKPYAKIVHTHVAQKLSYTVWAKFEAYLYSNGDEIHFSKWDEFRCIEGKDNSSIRFENGNLVLCKGNKHCCISIPVKRTKDKYGYEDEALSRKVHFCKIVRRWYPNGWTYFVQIVLSGTPPVKVNPATGELLHALGNGRVGHDIGPQTLATMSDGHVFLGVIAEDVQTDHDKLRRLNRAMDRSRRASNPRMFTEDGQIVPINRLPQECVKNGRRNWKDSKRYKKLKARRRYLYRKEAELRDKRHHELANKLIAYGDDHYIETMNWPGLAKRSKETKVSEKTGKHVSKKRFGKSISNKAPASLVNILEAKVVSQGGKFRRINTYKAKASQFDHTNKAYKKKHLSQRWAKLSDGTAFQRDLYSAFLLQCTNESLDGFVQQMLEEKFANALRLHNEAIAELQASDHKKVSSMGIKAA